jgi:hypothetical protein
MRRKQYETEDRARTWNSNRRRKELKEDAMFPSRSVVYL